MTIERLEFRRLLSFDIVGGPTPVTGSGSVIDYDLAVAGNGTFIVATLSAGATEHTADIAVTRYSAAGDQIGNVITLSTINGAGQFVRAGADARGDAIVAYTLLESRTSGPREIDFVRISKDGVVSAAARATAPLPHVDDYVFYPDLAMDDSGGFFVGWVQWDSTHSDAGYSVQAHAFDASGVEKAPEFVAYDVTGFGDSANQLDIDTKPDGSSAVFTFASTGEGPSVVNAQRVGTSRRIGEVFPAAPGAPSGEKRATSVAVAADGSFVIGYLDQSGGLIGGPFSDYAVFVQRFDSSANPVGDPIDVGDGLTGDGLKKLTTSIDVDVMPDGGFVTSFAQQHITFSSGDVKEGTEVLYARRFSANGISDDSGLIDLGHSLFPGANDFTGVGPRIGAAPDGSTVVLNRVTKEDLLVFSRLGADVGGTASVSNGVLYVLGTVGSDAITISISGSNIVVDRGGGKTQTFAANTVNVIDVDALDGDDTITNNTSLKATLRGGAGSDTIFGGTGEDRIHGGIGNDSLWGGDGVDKIFGEDGVDSCYGNGGNDRIEGGAQPDHIRGNGGRDKLFGNGGHDHIYGGASGDWIYGQAGNDQLSGEGGNDHLYGDDGFADTLSGGAGDDVLISLDGAIDHLNGDGGHDTATADTSDILAGIEVGT